MIQYSDFLQAKRLLCPSAGREVPEEQINGHLFPFQKALTIYALRKGRSACWASTGLGKTRICLAWAEHAAERVLILCPLAVAQQTVREGERIGIPVTYARHQDQAAARGITITNYEMMDAFAASTFGAVALDESSILKAVDGKTRAKLTETFRDTPYKLCLTATPAPNDQKELANHAEFLGILTRAEFLSAFFVHDDSGWRLKGHAKEPFYRWLASWAMSLNKPSDLGAFSDEGYNLPPLTIEPVFVATDYIPEGRLFPDRLQGVTERAAVRRDTIDERVEAAVGLILAEPEEPWIAWCGLNEEGRALAKWLPDSVLIEGPQSADEKVKRMEQFLSGEKRVLVTKPSVSGFGLNLQHCARMVFVGLSDSWEAYFQCLRRCWRFGQQREVEAYIVLSEPEEVIYRNVLAKEREAEKLSAELIANAAEYERQEIGQVSARSDYRAERGLVLPRWLRGGEDG